MTKLNRGDIWLINLDPTVGSEINKTRPAVIISRSDYNQAADTFTILPISSGRFLPSFHVWIESLKDGSFVSIPQVRVASKKRLIKKMGKLTDSEMNEAMQKLRFYLDMD